jgi:hypothetical protein
MLVLLMTCCFQLLFFQGFAPVSATKRTHKKIMKRAQETGGNIQKADLASPRRGQKKFLRSGGFLLASCECGGSRDQFSDTRRHLCGGDQARFALRPTSAFGTISEQSIRT